MVRLTDVERSLIRDVWDKVNTDEVGPEIISRILIVYPWTERHFGTFGDIFTITAILQNSRVSNHGKVVLQALDRAVKNMDNIKLMFQGLSRMHFEKLNVDPESFRLLADCITIAMACKLRSAMNPEVQAAWQKFLYSVVDAMNKQYH
ncbi:hemoglobin cathodic subunit beta-like [Gouania willdenowi]|uniref:Hemoglobin cathodic subunit beta-like n=1 Tax=Gouania willdenowi TaxID=441366 RepID=A0A8C5G755_GOUWI|nr:hemoglobin cathodic subunit beta-like [Gouania willdenowi]